MEQEIAVIGSLNKHTILLPGPKSFIGLPGGYALYAAAGARLWGEQVKLVSRVGENYSREWLDRFKTIGIDPSGVQIHSDFIDHRFFESYSEKFERFVDQPISRFLEKGLLFPRELFNYEPPNEAEPPANLSPKLGEIPVSCKFPDAVLIGPLDYKTQYQLVNLYQSRGIKNIGLELDPSYIFPNSLNKIYELIDGLEAVFIQEEHLLNLFKGNQITRWSMLKRIAEGKVSQVVALRSLNQQMLYISGTEEKWIIPQYDSPIIDPSGHKAAFCGAFMGSYAQGHDPIQSAIRGNVAGSICMETTGYEQLIKALPGLCKARAVVQSARIYKA